MANKRTLDGRIKFSRRAILAAFGVLGGRLWMLQGRSSDRYNEAADQQRFRYSSLPGRARRHLRPRRQRAGAQRAQLQRRDHPRPTCPSDEVELQRVLERASRAAQHPTAPGGRRRGDSIEAVVEKASKLPLLEPVFLRRGVDQETAFLIEQQQLALPGSACRCGPSRVPLRAAGGARARLRRAGPAEAVEEYEAAWLCCHRHRWASRAWSIPTSRCCGAPR